MTTRPRPLVRGLVAVALTSAVVVTGAPGVAFAQAPSKQTSANKRPAHLSPFSARLVAVMNSTRKAHGLAPLKAVESIGRVASGWSVRLADDDVLSHNPRLAAQIQRIFPNWSRIEENVGALDSASTQSAADGQAMAEAYLESTEHRANILDPHVRWIGVANATGDGAIWNTIDFVG